MRKLILFIGMALILCPLSAARNNQRSSVRVTDFSLTQSPGTVDIGFNIVIGDRAAGRSYVMGIVPILVNGNHRREFAPVVVEGKDAKLLDKRRSRISGETRHYTDYYAMATNGQSVAYSISVPYEKWMKGSSLYFEYIDLGCNCAKRHRLGIIADNFIIDQDELYRHEVVEVPGAKIPVGEQLAAIFPFVKHISQYRPFDEQSRDQAVTIYFRQGISEIDRNFRGNNRTLVDVLSIIRELEASADSKVARVVIAGYASPEGTYRFNTELSESRAVAARDFISYNSDFPASGFQLYTGSEDWAGLRRMISASDMAEKNRILDIIDTTPVWDETSKRRRLDAIKRIDRGRTYKYMYDNMFPDLRNATYITIYYDDK